MKRTTSSEPQYDNYQRMLAKKAWQFCHLTDCEFDEAMSTANLAFFKAKQSYEPEKASFSTHLYWALKGAFLEDLNSHRKQSYEVPQEEQEHQDSGTLKRIELMEWLISLPPLAYKVAAASLNNPCDVLFAPTRGSHRTRVLNRLIDTCTWGQVERGIKGLKVALRELPL